MKLALFLTGFLRHARRSRKYIFDQFYKHDVDIYVATWNERGISMRENKSIVDDQQHVDVEYVRELYGERVKAIWIGDLAEYNKTRKSIVANPRDNDIFKTDGRAMEHIRDINTLYWPNRLMDQWYVVKQASDLCGNFGQYDVVFKSRADLNFTCQIPLECSKPGIHTSTFYLGNSPYSMEDKFAWGNPADMFLYLIMYNHIQLMYDKDNIDISWAEHLMGYYIRKWCNLPICTHSEFYNGNGQFYGAHIYDPLTENGPYEYYQG